MFAVGLAAAAWLHVSGGTNLNVAAGALYAGTSWRHLLPRYHQRAAFIKRSSSGFRKNMGVAARRRLDIAVRGRAHQADNITICRIFTASLTARGAATGGGRRDQHQRKAASAP
jgi:hypothetical protein